MVRSWLLVLVVAVGFAMVGTWGCGDSSGKTDPVDDTSVDTSGDVSGDGNIDTSQPPTSTGPSRVGLVSGAGQRESANYKMNITVGSPVTSHKLQSSQYRMTLGVGATP